MQILQDHAGGQISLVRLLWSVRDLRNRRHESKEGKFAIDDAIDRTLTALETTKGEQRR
jgi:hypothetical protein